MLSQTVEYALRAIVSLASAPAVSKPARTIADEMHVPPLYLCKIMQRLVLAGIVHAQRGKTGGFKLARPANRITVLEVVNAIDPIRRIGSCPLHLDHHRDQLCALHAKLDQALAGIEALFRGTLISEVVERVPVESPAALVQVAGAL